MDRIGPYASRRNNAPMTPLPLFVWADARDRRYAMPVRIVAARHGLSLATAATVCELAGIGKGGVR